MWQGTVGDGHNKYTVGVETTGEHLGNTETEHDVQETRDLQSKTWKNTGTTSKTYELDIDKVKHIKTHDWLRRGD